MAKNMSSSWTDFRVALACAPPAVQKQLLGEKIYPLVATVNPQLAGKVTGLLLHKENGTLLTALEDESQTLLRQHIAQEGANRCPHHYFDFIYTL